MAVEAVRRTIALAIETLCESTISTLLGLSGGKGGLAASAAADALRQAQEFLSEVSGPPATKEEEIRLTSTLHALDHASRFADMAQEETKLTLAKDADEDARALELSEEAMRSAALAVRDIAVEAALSATAQPIKSLDTPNSASSLANAERCANMLRDLRRKHRQASLSAVGMGKLTVDEAMVRVDAVQRLEALAHHAWRSSAHLHGRGEPNASPLDGGE